MSGTGGFNVGVAELEWLKNLSNQAAGAVGKVKILEELSDSERSVYVTADGQISERIKTAPPRIIRFDSIAEFETVLEHAKQAVQETRAVAGALPTIYVSSLGVRIIWDDSTSEFGRAKDRSYYLRVPHDEIDRIVDGIRGAQQKQFVQILRTDLKYALGELASTLIPAVSSMRWNSGASGSMAVGPGRESMGREINSEIKSTVGEIPEELVLQVRLVEDPAIPTRYPIRCVLDIDPQQQQFSLRPMAGEISNAWNLFTTELQEYVKERAGDCVVIRGSRDSYEVEGDD